jgi:hypothetical protein
MTECESLMRLAFIILLVCTAVLSFLCGVLHERSKTNGQ